MNDIAKEQGGTPSADGTIASALDALNDALAGSDQPAAQTIEAAVALLGQHIGGGGGSKGISVGVADGDFNITWVDTPCVYPAANFDGDYAPDTDQDPVTSAPAGAVVGIVAQPLIDAGKITEMSSVSMFIGDKDNFAWASTNDGGPFDYACFAVPEDGLAVVVVDYS